MENRIKNEDGRIIGLDILRIVAMVLITLRHFVGYSGLGLITDPYSVNGILVRLIEIFCGCAVNLFVLISGFFLVESKFKWERAVKIWGETFFYSVLCFAGAVILGFEQVTSGKLLLSVLPLLSRHYWFTVAYIALYLVSPFINKMLNSLTKREYTWLVIGGAVLLSAWTTFIYFSAGVMTGGHTGLLWFMYIYCVGGYLRKNREYIPKKRFCIIGAIAAIMVLMGYSLLQKKFAFLQNFPVLQDDSIIILLISLFLFAAFLNVSIKSAWCQKLIKAIAVGAFGVYLIQESCMVRQGLWERLIKPEQYADKWYLIPLALLVVVCLFAAAFIGHRLFELLYKLVKNCLERRSRKATQK